MPGPPQMTQRPGRRKPERILVKLKQRGVATKRSRSSAAKGDKELLTQRIKGLRLYLGDAKKEPVSGSKGKRHAEQTKAEALLTKGLEGDSTM